MVNDFPIKLKKENNINKKEIISKNSIIEQISCPFCKKEFKSSTSIKELNIHIKRCGVKFIQVNKACELFPPSQDYELNDLIYENSEKYEVINKDKSIDVFDKKIEKLKNVINSVKISWQDEFCQLYLNKNNLLNK